MMAALRSRVDYRQCGMIRSSIHRFSQSRIRIFPVAGTTPRSRDERSSRMPRWVADLLPRTVSNLR